ncbi:methyltransferase domain-containing protein [Clostridium ljungdahlii]|uniref:Methyltransferase domain protein n=1 Tax=Clostridium ljungdahlii TaxID=1538 RepID=A0A170NBD3_9CLOT|nr:methyltransferase domain-containing protein [Clostridium ljungdahlii]OAA83183.1 Methyltransferase domain protein [Clostridium ljungdahlii]
MMNYLKIANIISNSESMLINDISRQILKKCILDCKLNAVVEDVKVYNLDSNYDYDAYIIKKEDSIKYSYLIDALEIEENRLIVLEDSKENILLNVGKLYRLENQMKGKKIVVANIQKINYDITKEKFDWVYEQLEISLQILLNKGYKIKIFSISKEEESIENKKLCEDFVYKFQNKNIQYYRDVQSVVKYIDVIRDAEMSINLSMDANILCAALGKPFITINLDRSYTNFCKKFGLNDVIYNIDEINVGKITNKIFSSKSMFECQQIEKLINLSYEKNTKVIEEKLKVIKVKEKTKSIRSIRNISNNKIYKLNKNSINKLELGCGKNPMPGWIHLDYMNLSGVDVVANLDTCDKVPLPFEDNTIDEFFGSHVIEHISKPLPMMEELHRIAKPGAIAVFRCPYGSSDDAFENPTHVRQYFLHSYGYFSQPYYWREDYGYKGDWKVNKVTLFLSKKRYQYKSKEEIFFEINSYRNVVLEMMVELIALKPIREQKKELQTPDNIEFVLVDM